jgi:hypothetical protein
MLYLRKHKILFFVLISVFLLDTCKKETVEIENDFQQYYDSFIQIANEKKINLPTIKTIIQFTDDSNAPSGACYQNPTTKTIKINRAVWELYETNLNGRENIIFHELGHCLLNREHDNSTLSNGEFKTMMIGTTGGTASFLNYRGIRRKYYIDELFDLNTPEPIWAQVDKFKDNITASQKKLLVSQTFSKIDIAEILSNDPKNMTVENAGLEINTDSQNFSNFTLKSILETIANSQNIVNFEAEVKIQVDKGFGGIRCFFTEDTNNSLLSKNAFTFIFYPDKIHVGSRNLIQEKVMNLSGIQTLRIRKIKNDVYLFIGNSLVAQADVVEASTPAIDVFGKLLKWHFLFVVRPDSKVRLIDFNFYELVL